MDYGEVSEDDLKLAMMRAHLAEQRALHPDQQAGHMKGTCLSSHLNLTRLLPAWIGKGRSARPW